MIKKHRRISASKDLQRVYIGTSKKTSIFGEEKLTDEGGAGRGGQA